MQQHFSKKIKLRCFRYKNIQKGEKSIENILIQFDKKSLIILKNYNYFI